MQSTFSISEKLLHVAMIMDGNGRWASARGLPRTAGHRAGVKTVQRVVEAAPDLGIRTLTLYAFSSDNWKRPPLEVNQLMRLLQSYLLRETANCVKHGIKLSVIGRRDQLPRAIQTAIEAAESATKQGSALHVRLAVDYSSRDAILKAAALANGHNDISRSDFAQLIAQAINEENSVPDVDLLIRTGGEQRLSDFLLWECAYAELYFTERQWPDFNKEDLRDALTVFHRRERRFGQVPKAASNG
ncbi:MAG TPA: di-trans,poly-cis-decaprenylcistransferase [Blastocatellia bacterium]|nr:di-trans,poly-cis-decaprenylcistransferase [Blastocatellia bacterium]